MLRLEEYFRDYITIPLSLCPKINPYIDYWYFTHCRSQKWRYCCWRNPPCSRVLTWCFWGVSLPLSLSISPGRWRNTTEESGSGGHRMICGRDRSEWIPSLEMLGWPDNWGVLIWTKMIRLSKLKILLKYSRNLTGPWREWKKDPKLTGISTKLTKQKERKLRREESLRKKCILSQPIPVY